VVAANTDDHSTLGCNSSPTSVDGWQHDRNHANALGATMTYWGPRSQSAPRARPWCVMAKYAASCAYLASTTSAFAPACDNLW